MQDLVNKQNVIVFLLVLLVIVTMTWLMLPRIIKFCAAMIDKAEEEQKFRQYLAEGKATEGFSGEEKKSEQINMPEPKINAEVGSIVDGPGFEKGGVDGVGQEILSTIPSNYYFLDDGADGAMSVQHNLCSKSCCSAQWPTPFKQKYDPYVCNNKSQYVSSQLFCNNSFQDSGCLCLTKDQARNIYNRGGNGRELF